jgi:arylformamidase
MSAIDWDDAYANAAHIKGAEDYPPRWAAAAAAFREGLATKGRCEPDIGYGAHPRERFDLFLPDVAPRGLIFFVHGGYWRAFDKSSWSHLAAGGLGQGFAVAMPSYVLCPEVRIAQITQQIARAIELASSRIAGPIHLCGHSAGGHLVSRMLCDDLSWQGGFPARLARVVSISGLHDLRPLLNTAMNDDLRLDQQEARAESPVFCRVSLPVDTIAWVGGDERPAFVEQSRWLARDWGNAEVRIEAGRHHFDVIDALADADSALMAALLG